MTEAHPILFRWMGDGFKPANTYMAKRADEIYVVHELYRMIEQQDRSPETHKHYFAALSEA